MTRQKPVVLCILDGWGFREETAFNAIEEGKTPVWHELVKTSPSCMLKTSGLDVGLPNVQMGKQMIL